jgi:hypothetical protein
VRDVQAFDRPWWDLDQVVAWAETREREAVEYTAFGVGGLRLPPSTQKIADWIRDTASRMGASDINAELWAASKWPPLREVRSKRARSFNEALACPELPEAAALVAAYFHAEKNDRFFLRLIFDGPIAFENERDIPSSHPTMAYLSPEMRELVRAYCARSEAQSSEGSRPLQKFPTAAFVLQLLREGRFTARGHLPGEPLARELSSDDWASLEIQVGGWHNRLCVWRTLPPATDRNGDIENVLVRRAEVLRVWPPIPSTPATDNARLEKSLAPPTKAEAAASVLRRLFPEGRPSLSYLELARRVQEEMGAKVPVAERTMARAIQIAWPRSSRRGRPARRSAKSAKSAK